MGRLPGNAGRADTARAVNLRTLLVLVSPVLRKPLEALLVRIETLEGKLAAIEKRLQDRP